LLCRKRREERGGEGRKASGSPMPCTTGRLK
jgi:hypothetical protein